ncbi:hypothetical protein ACHQM5_008897 [Ranunculus cassubicifolius]
MKKLAILVLFLMFAELSSSNELDVLLNRPSSQTCMETVCMPQCESIKGVNALACPEKCREGCAQASRGGLLSDHVLDQQTAR